MSNETLIKTEDLCVREKRNRFRDEMGMLYCEAGCLPYIRKDTHASRLSGKTVASSSSHYIGDRLWRLDNMVTHRDWRGKGIATAHIQRLLQKIKEKQKTAIALFFEIESRLEKNLTEQERQSRNAVARFFENCGARAWPGKLLVPNGNLAGDTIFNMELMWIPIGRHPTQAEIRRILHYILCEYTELSSRHSLYRQVVCQQFKGRLPTKLASE